MMFLCSRVLTRIHRHRARERRAREHRARERRAREQSACALVLGSPRWLLLCCMLHLSHYEKAALCEKQEKKKTTKKKKTETKKKNTETKTETKT